MTDEIPPSSRRDIPKRTVKDFKFIKEIGNGSYSTVFLAIETATNRQLAIKAVSKELVTRCKKVAQVFREKEILARLMDSSYIVKLYCTFQDEKTLYYGLTYCPNGDLLHHITELKYFPENVTRFYTAEILEAIEYIHSKKVIHRDLKPENILLTDTFHIQLTDFGSGRILDDEQIQQRSSNTDDSNIGDEKKLKRLNSFVGTAQFVAPEILSRKPVHYGHEYDIYNAVARAGYTLADDLPPLIADIIRKLVVLTPSERLGSEETGGFISLKSHDFFIGVPWNNLQKEISPLRSNDSSNINSFTISDEDLKNMKPGYDGDVQARLIGLKMADNNDTGAKITSAIDKQSTSSTQNKNSSTSSSSYSSQSSNNAAVNSSNIDGVNLNRNNNNSSNLILSNKSSYVLSNRKTDELRIEQKDSKTFLVNVPGRSYHLTDPNHNAVGWCQDLCDIHIEYYGSNPLAKIDSYYFMSQYIYFVATNYNDDRAYQTSVEDVSEETRYILEEFILERAADDGVDLGLVKPILDFDPLSLPQYRQIQMIAQTLRLIGDELDQDIRLKSMVEQVPLHSPYETFSDVAKELFNDGIYNWGRIVTLFYFAYKLIMKSLTEETSVMKMIVDWTVRFVREIVAPWIVRKGGWFVILRDCGPNSKLSTIGILLSGVLATFVVALYFMRRP
ncbi:unnamed protein product [Didymodactylos carnosus]|uniref:3-phosphoinositide-dependent protein kinase 1 n=1 Tax=Didymodactylos carnosus TaxID=1234261 RepID=A0A814D7M3_9BILA|nr:unnamed protein product [Didymodactylos carnosus]CAF0951477.1 unnamed protein product [Didymodactylos carnosus]CAF3619963.1 unnamed protein product [Didymodactylos carnosus]CAF3727128.1 unnamed protein product [Didymodactylos carnosus]